VMVAMVVAVNDETERENGAGECRAYVFLW